MYLAAVLTPYKGISYQDKKKTPSAIEYILRDVLKLGTQNHFLDGIPALFSSSIVLQNPVLTSERFLHASQRVALGLCLIFLWLSLSKDVVRRALAERKGSSQS